MRRVGSSVRTLCRWHSERKKRMVKECWEARRAEVRVHTHEIPMGSLSINAW
jgi:hypothetical protein